MPPQVQREGPWSIPADDDHGRFAHAKEVRNGILDEHTDRIPRGEMNPIEGPLNVRKSALKRADYIGIWSDPETNALDDAGKAPAGLGQHIDIGPHSGRDVLQLPFAKVGESPPAARVNQNEHLLAHVGQE